MHPPIHAAPLLVLFWSSVAIAGVGNYKCTVTQFYEPSTDGKLLPKIPDAPDTKSPDFMVDRLSGQIVGDYIPNARAVKIDLANKGNDEMSFMVVSHFDTAGHGGRVEFLQISEYLAGKAKPFIAIALSGILVGTCE